MNLQEKALDILKAAIAVVKPHQIFQDQISMRDNVLYIKDVDAMDLLQFDKIYVIGAGKASAYLAFEMEKLLGDRISGGVVVTKYKHSAPCKKIKTLEAGHPVLDENGLKATAEILNFLKKTTAKDLVICMISGGGSALLEKLPEGISFEDLQSVNKTLLACGAQIDEVNTVRKHLSLVKGGKLLSHILPAACISLIISDVIGDDAENIASGLTVPGFSSITDVEAIIKKYHLHDRFPQAIWSFFNKCLALEVKEKPNVDTPQISGVKNIILANNLMALQAAQKIAKEFGFNTIILTDKMQGEARDIAQKMAEALEKIALTNKSGQQPVCIIFGGETTVTLSGNGKGGRNQEFVLAAIPILKKLKEDFVFLSCGTDGTDGLTDAAGAILTKKILNRIEKLQINPAEYLNNNDSYHFFERVNGLIKIGPTGTNVMDIGIGLIQ